MELLVTISPALPTDRSRGIITRNNVSGTNLDTFRYNSQNWFQEWILERNPVCYAFVICKMTSLVVNVMCLLL